MTDGFKETGAGSIDMFSVVLEKEQNPGDGDNDAQWEQNAEKVVLDVPLRVKLEVEMRPSRT